MLSHVWGLSLFRKGIFIDHQRTLGPGMGEERVETGLHDGSTQPDQG